jgi:hypothetical protein
MSNEGFHPRPGRTRNHCIAARPEQRSSSPCAPTSCTSPQEGLSVREKLNGALRSWAAGAAVALALAGCGGGEAVSPTSAAPAQLDQVAALTLAQQSVNARMATLPRAVALAAVSPATATVTEDFENGIADWSNWGNAQVVAGVGTSGSKAMQVGTGAGGAGLSVPGIVAGTAYRLTAQVKVSDPADPVYIGINMLDGSGGQVIGHSSPAITSTGYVTVTVDLVAPANSANAVVWIWKNAGSGYAFLDDVSFGPPTSPPPPPTTAPGPNLVSNGGFESGMANWVNWGNASVSSQANSGTSALAVGTAAGGAGQSVTGITAGAVYRLVAQAKVSDPSETVFVGVNLLNQAGAAVAQMALPVSSTTYNTLTFDITAPADAVNAVVYVWKNAGSGLGFVDDFAFGPASASTPPPTDQLTPNLLVNGSFAGSLYGWQNWGNATVPTGSMYTQNWWLNVGTGAGGAGQRVAGIVAGKTYRLYGRMDVSVAGETGYLGLKFLDAAGKPVQDQVVPFSATAPDTVSLTLVAPSNAASALAYVWKNAGSGLASVDFLTLAQVGVAPPPPPSVQLSASAQERVDTPDGLTGRSGESIARLVDGNYVVAWVSAGVGAASAVCFQRVDANLARLGSTACIAGAQPIGPGDTPGYGDVSTTKVLPRPDGGFVIVWNVKAGTANGGYTVVLGERSQAFDSAGSPVGGIQDGPQQPVPSRAAALTGGGYVVVSGAPGQTRAPDVSNLFFQRYSADGTPIGSPTSVGDRAGAAPVVPGQTQPVFETDITGGAQVVPLSGGGFAVAWNEYSGTYTRMFTADGTPVGEPVLAAVATSFCTTAPDCFSESLSDLIPMEDGGYLVIWNGSAGGNFPTGGTFARRFRPDGSPGTSVTKLSVAFSAGAAAPAGSDGFVGVWSDLLPSFARQILMQRFDATPLR